MLILRYVVLLFLLELISLYILVLNNVIVNIISLIINVICTFIIIKRIEKRYYKKFNKLSSLLYNLCPLLGVSILFIIINYLFPIPAISYLKMYYITVFILAYLINIIYIIICNFKHS